jgi:AsmA family protein
MVSPVSWQRHRLAIAMGIAATALFIALGLCEWQGWPFLAKPLQRMLSAHLERDVTLGSDFRMHLLGPLRIHTNALHIGPPRWAGEDKTAFFEASRVDLKLPWSTVWNVAAGRNEGPLHIRALEVGHFTASLWRLENGRANWEFGTDDAKTKKKTPQLPAFDRLVVSSGQLTLDDVPSGLALRVQASTREGLQSAAEQGLSVQGNGQWRSSEFNFTLHSTGVLPLIAGEDADAAVPVTLRGRTAQGQVAFDGEVSDVMHLQALKGAFKIKATSLAEAGAPFGLTLPTTSPFEAEGRLSRSGAVWKAQIAKFEVGSSRLGGNFTFDPTAETPLLSGTLQGRRLDMHDLGPAFGSPAAGAPNPPPPEGRFFPDRPFDIPSLQKMNADIRVDLKLADLHTDVLQPFSPLQGHVLLRDGILSLEQINAHTAEGTVQGRLAVDGRTPSRPLWRGDLKLDGVELAQWLRLRDTHAKPADAAKRGEAPAMHYVSGRMGGHLQFSGAGRSVADMAASLSGTLAAWVNDGKISHLALEAAGLDLAQAIGVAIKGDDALPMQCAAAQFTARDGLLHADVAILDSKDTTVIVNGNLSLAQESLDLAAQAYPKDFSPAALRAPIHVEGPFRQPRVRLEKTPIVAKAAAAVALGAINPLAALIPLVDPGSAAPLGCQQAMQRLRHGVQGSEPPKVQAAGTEAAGGK